MGWEGIACSDEAAGVSRMWLFLLRHARSQPRSREAHQAESLSGGASCLGRLGGFPGAASFHYRRWVRVSLRETGAVYALIRLRVRMRGAWRLRP